MGETPQVLVVDDDPELRTLLEFDFRTNGFDVVTAANGAEALDYLQETDPSEYPDVIVLELLMPGVDGLTFLHRRIGHSFESVPVVVLTEDDGIETFREAYKLGVADYVTKPFSPPHLITRVEHIQ